MCLLRSSDPFLASSIKEIDPLSLIEDRYRFTTQTMPRAPRPATAAVRRTRAIRFAWTINNYTDETIQALDALFNRHQGEQILYQVAGREVCPTTGTPHLQGFTYLGREITWNAFRALMPAGTHIEVAYGTTPQNIEYCKKEGDAMEWGNPPDLQQGKRTDLQIAFDWADSFIAANGRAPTSAEWSFYNPSLLVRYRNIVQVCDLRASMIRPVSLVDVEATTLHIWQQDIYDGLTDSTASDRSIIFLVDPQGGAGKTFLQHYVATKFPDETQMWTVGSGKATDFCYDLNVRSKYIFLNVPRGSMEFVPYALLEKLKDRVVFSSKYESRTKLLHQTPHIVVFSNENPDMEKLTLDRYDTRIFRNSNGIDHFWSDGADHPDAVGLPLMIHEEAEPEDPDPLPIPAAPDGDDLPTLEELEEHLAQEAERFNV